ncbi:hypothetical protein [Pelomonas sp. SE-A7]|uniref:hypothetical protein n=1 Tax=Pelomonas sp. SE-A7 TaxID=3054953 RepID=UPI00259D0442|nr:hypothetical protein [Pelomonas sp. SE-A7]MDM4768544.1 hypothetical protein [Pelomonas sp. SE-A7]
MGREELYGSALQNMQRTVHNLAERVPQPQKIPYKTSFVFRYVERLPEQALVQKLARVVTTLKAATVLMQHGLVQEQGALQRVIHEIHEDIIFLAYGLIFNDLSPLHKLYLDAFYEEEFDADDPIESTQKRPMVRRSKIQAYIANKDGVDLDPSGTIALSKTLTKTYSGFVHAASPQIMDMYGGAPPHFHIEGMLGTRHHAQYRMDLWNYYYRSILAFGMVAKAFGDDDLFEQIRDFTVQFEEAANKSYTSKRGKASK